LSSARLLDATDEFVAGELEIRAAARRRNRALSLMKDVRHAMVQLAARHGLGMARAVTNYTLVLRAPAGAAGDCAIRLLLKYAARCGQAAGAECGNHAPDGAELMTGYSAKARRCQKAKS
jgi:hypothetical protein